MNVNTATRLMLGTAQLGMSYGVANRTGRPDRAEARAMVAACLASGVRAFDTAQAYGESEQALGDALSDCGATDVQIVTKLHPDLDLASEAVVREAVGQSLSRLRIPRLWGLLLHREGLLPAWEGVLGRTLRALVREGRVEHIGVSTYGAQAALAACRAEGLDLLQFPASVFDRRAERAGLAEVAARAGVHLMVRSVFLQGLALMPPETVPVRIPRAAEAVKAFAAFCGEQGVVRREFALHHVACRWPHAQLVVGAERADQIRGNVAALAAPQPDADTLQAWDRAWPDDVTELVEPYRWPA